MKKNVLLVSYSVTPEIDSVSQLKKYAIEKGVKDNKWNLLTGDKKQIYDLARRSYLVAKNDGDGGKYDMIHTENFVLIDKEKRIRGFYDGTSEEEMEKLLIDVEILENSYKNLKMRNLKLIIYIFLTSSFSLNAQELVIAEERVEPGIIFVFEGAIKDHIMPSSHAFKRKSNQCTY